MEAGFHISSEANYTKTFMARISGLLIDLDGTVYNDSVPIPGAVDAIRWLRGMDVPFRFLTNTTMKSRGTLQQKLAGMGIHVAKEEIFSAAYAGLLYVRQTPSASCHLLILDDAKKEYANVRSESEMVDYVVVGDLGDEMTFAKLNKAFRCLFNGAKLVALQKNRYWLSDQGYTLDAGAFVALLEYAANTEAILIGKPAPAFFKLALKDLRLPAEEVLMIGDDIEADVGGAQTVGMRAALVRTGKFRQEDLARANIRPDFLLDSLAHLPTSKPATLMRKSE